MFIKSIVLPCMKKGNVYTVKVVLHPSGDIAKACCGCPAGVDGRCNHLAATLFAIEDHWNNVPCDTDSAVSQQQVTVPCTHASGISLKKEIEYRACPVTKISKA